MDVLKPSLDELRIEREPEREVRHPFGLGVIVLILVALLAGAGLWVVRPKAVEVRSVTVRETETPDQGRTVLNASGYVIARRNATVSSKVTGKIVAVLIEEGMSVTNGQVLAQLDDANVRASLDIAHAELESAAAAMGETRALLREADLERERTATLVARGVEPRAALDRAQSEADSLRARLSRQQRDAIVAERRIALGEQQVEDMVIRAPFDGIITVKNAQPGEMISPVSAGGGFTRTGIGTLVDMDSLEIEIDVNESYINRVRPGQPVEATLDAYPDWRIPCRVIAIIPTADRQRSTVRVRVAFDELDLRILPQMAVKVAFRNDTEPGDSGTVLVPKGCVREEDGRDVIFVVRQGAAERRAVLVGQARDDHITIRSGVTAGERVILNPPAELEDGTPVKERSA